MAEDKSKIVLTDQEYNRGVLLNEYQGKWSLVTVDLGNDGTPWKQFVFPQVYDKNTKQRVAGSKAIPNGVYLGASPAEAVKNLSSFIDMLDPDGTLRVPF